MFEQSGNEKSLTFDNIEFTFVVPSGRFAFYVYYATIKLDYQKLRKKYKDTLNLQRKFRSWFLTKIGLCPSVYNLQSWYKDDVRPWQLTQHRWLWRLQCPLKYGKTWNWHSKEWPNVGSEPPSWIIQKINTIDKVILNMLYSVKLKNLKSPWQRWQRTQLQVTKNRRQRHYLFQLNYSMTHENLLLNKASFVFLFQVPVDYYHEYFHHLQYCLIYFLYLGMCK